MSVESLLKPYPPWVYHICSQSEWLVASATDHYSHASLEQEGFIHFSFAHQVDKVLVRHFSGARDLVLLEIDMSGLDANKLISEDLYGLNELYPHYYDSVPIAAVERVIAIET